MKKHSDPNIRSIAMLSIAIATLAVTLCASCLFTEATMYHSFLTTSYALTLEPTPVPPHTPAPTPTQVPAHTPAPTPMMDELIEPVVTLAPTPEPFDYLPVVRRGVDSGKRIAITVDDCYQYNNLANICQMAAGYSGRLTLFPVGEALEHAKMDDLLRHYVFNYGFEIENHTYSHARIFRLSEEEMASEIWRQQDAVSRALGVHYHQSFFRLTGGDGEYDQRTHNYLAQLGYRGVAGWSVSGSDSTPEMIVDSLAPGKIYLFHATDSDTEKLQWFIPYAVSQGYELVTLNELLGYEPNAMGNLSDAPAEMPAPKPYTVEYREQKKGDYSWAIVELQRALLAQGYLTGSADGVYGSGTEAAVAAFQRANNLPETGVADPETQKLLAQFV